MLYKKQNWNLDWQRQPASNYEPKGNMLLVSANKSLSSSKPVSTRCVWPTSIMASESRVFTRKLTVRVS